MSAELKHRHPGTARKIFDYIFHPTIKRRILFGYLSLTVLIIMIAIYTLSSLERLNAINRSVLQGDVQVVETTDRMIDNLFAQELYARRYFVLNSPEMLALFRERSNEFYELVEKIRMLSGEYAAHFERIEYLHAEYDTLIIKFPSSQPDEAYTARIKQKQDEIISLIKEVSSKARRTQFRKMARTEKIGTNAYKVAGILCGLGVILSIVTALLITRNISHSIDRLKQATKEISEGRFEYTSGTANRDELGELSIAFSEMAKRLKRLEEIYLDASPLTHLPGGVAIERKIADRLRSGPPAAFCFADLDNFKAYNDRYSYARGNDVIKATARLLEKTLEEHRSDGDFIGHIGGDDFVIIASPDHCDTICDNIIRRFDDMIADYYDPEDVSKGYIISINRQEEEVRFPIMSISMAIINTRQREIRNPIQLGEIAAELKHYAKSRPGSVCISEKRQNGYKTGGGENVIRFPGKN